jgi:DNA-directed RNA polymerase specialized sigma24 family protein
MHVVDGFSHTEISEQLGITESTSRAALTKARTKIINHLQKTEPASYNWAKAL